MRGDVTYRIVRAQVERLLDIGARDSCIASERFIERSPSKVCVRTDEWAVAFTSTECRSTGEREQRQDRNNYGSGQDHVDGGEGKVIGD